MLRSFWEGSRRMFMALRTRYSLMKSKKCFPIWWLIRRERSRTGIFVWDASCWMVMDDSRNGSVTSMCLRRRSMRSATVGSCGGVLGVPDVSGMGAGVGLSSSATRGVWESMPRNNSGVYITLRTIQQRMPRNRRVTNIWM